MYITDAFERMSHLPIVTKRFGKNKKEPDDFANMHDAVPDDIELKDFSDDIDVEGLGGLLSGGMPTVESPGFNVDSEQPSKPKKSKNFAENIGMFIRSIADKIGNEKQKGDIPDLPDAAESPDAPNYISETVSFADFQNEQQDEEFDIDYSEPTLPNDSLQNFGGQEMSDDDFGFSPEPLSDFSRDDNIYMPQEQQEMPSFRRDYANNFDGYPQLLADFGQNVPQYQPYDSNVQDAEDNYASFEQAAQISAEPTDAYEDEEQPVRRPHDIMGAVRARIEQFRRRLPSFKPKEYTMPEPSYDETQVDSVRSPSLAADIEKIISKQSDLGEVAREYEEMRQYIRSVDENAARIPRHEIAPPENIHEVYSAQNELFDMIYQIGAENEQQRSRIGVYERPQEEDPYNYRGINDDRQNYTDIEAASFSMSPSMDFESENKVSFERMMWERQQYQTQLANDTLAEDDGFDSDFDDDFFGMEQSRPRQKFMPDFDQESVGDQIMDDGFDDDLIFDDDTPPSAEDMPLDDSFDEITPSDERTEKGLFGIRIKPRRR